jgi:hypothetical protein
VGDCLSGQIAPPGKALGCLSKQLEQAAKLNDLETIRTLDLFR